MSDASPAVAVRFVGFGIAYSREGGDLVLLEDVSLAIPAGGFYLLVGESGAGKSSLLRLLTGLADPREPPPRLRGQLHVLGRAVHRYWHPGLRPRVAAVLQEGGLLDELSPRANVELALRAAGRSAKLAPALLSQAGLDQPPASVAELSGGMRKRVSVARALAADPELFLFDEPTAGLDAQAARGIAKLLRETHRAAAGRTTIVLTHDLQAFENLPDGFLRIDRASKKLIFGLADPALAAASPTQAARRGDEAGLLGVQRLLLEAAASTRTVLDAVLHLPPVYPGLVLRTTLRFLLEPALFVVLVSATIGGLSTFFALHNNPLEGAFANQVTTGVGKVLVAVLVPLLAGFFFTARMAAGAAARVGTMKRTSQIDGLWLMGICPADYLLTPLLWAMALAMPVVTAAGVVAAALASLAADQAVLGMSSAGWAKAFFATVDRVDMRFVLLKTVISGLVVAILTYHLATGPKRSGQDVGASVNSCIVLGMVAVLVVHSLLTLAQFR